MAQEPNVLKVEDVLTLIQTMNEANQKNLISAIQELKKPNEFEQEKLDKERKALIAKREERLRIGALHEQQKLMRMLSCAHQRPDGKTAWAAQVNTGDRCFQPMCVQCQSQLPKIPATVDQLQNGVNLNAIPGLDMKVLLEWHKRSYKGDCGNSDCVACHPEALNKIRENLEAQARRAQQLASQPAMAV